jgi:16S rRNA (guanine966-N2)-methyltransferase
MRIVGGRLKGRTIIPPTSRAIRPTSDRLRESIFDILAHRFEGIIDGALVIDIFAGSGALGFEALSRGAKSVLFVDNGDQALELLRANIASLALGDVARVSRSDATRLGKAPSGSPRFTLAFLDPPYAQGLAEPALKRLSEGGWLASHALVAVEESAKTEVRAPRGLRVFQERVYGDAKLIFLITDHITRSHGPHISLNGPSASKPKAS